MNTSADPVSETIQAVYGATAFESEPESPEPERGFMAVLQTDVYGFTKAVSVSEEVVALRVASDLDAFAKFCEAHHGRVVSHRGDGLKIVFPSAVEAVKAAVAMQSYSIAKNAAAGKDGQRIRHRIGLHVGDVIIVGQQILGKVPAVAKRLEEICPPGKFCYSDDVHQMVSQAVDFPRTYKGRQEVKNVALTVKCWVGRSPDDFSEEAEALETVTGPVMQTTRQLMDEYKRGFVQGFLLALAFVLAAGAVWFLLWSLSRKPPQHGDLMPDGQISPRSGQE